MENQIKVAVNVFVIKDNKVLMGKRLNSVGRGQWGFPGGHLEFGESLTAGAKRELFEETGLVVDELEFVHLLNQIQKEPDRHYIQINFIVKKWQGDPEIKEPTKCEKWQWFDLDKLPEDVFYAHRNFIPTLLKKNIFVDNDLC